MMFYALFDVVWARVVGEDPTADRYGLLEETEDRLDLATGMFYLWEDGPAEARWAAAWERYAETL